MEDIHGIGSGSRFRPEFRQNIFLSQTAEGSSLKFGPTSGRNKKKAEIWAKIVTLTLPHGTRLKLPFKHNERINNALRSFNKNQECFEMPNMVEGVKVKAYGKRQ